MSSKSLMKKSIAVLLAVMFLVSSFAFGLSAGSADKAVIDFSSTGNIISFKLPAGKIVEMIDGGTLSLQGIKNLIPDDMITAFQNDGIIGLLTSDTVMDAIPLTTLLGILPSSVLEEVAPTYEDVVDIIDVKEFVQENKINVDNLLANVSESDILAAMVLGGYATKAEAINAIKDAINTSTDISTVVDVKEVVEKVLDTNDGLATILDSIDDSAISEAVENMDPSKIIDAAKKYIDSLASAYTLTLNGEEIVSDGSISATAIAKAIIDVIPTTDTFTNLVANGGVIASLVLDGTLANSETTSIGIEIGLYGADEDIQAVADEAESVLSFISNHLNVTRTGSDVSVTLTAPAQAGVIISKILASTTISDTTKTDLISLLNGTVKEAIEYIASLSLDDVVAIVDEVATATENSKVAKVVDFFDSMTANHADACEKVRDAVVSFLTAIPDEFTDKTFAEIYTGSGTFNTQINLGVNIQAMLTTLGTTIPGLGSLASHVSSGVTPVNVDVTITLPTVHQVKFYDGYGDVAFVTYLAEGTPFQDVIDLYPDLAGNYTFDGTTVADVMPNADCEIYSDHIVIIYKVNFVQFDGTVVTVEYELGSTSITEPTVDPVLGYDAAWGLYELNVSPEITVELELTPLAGTLNRTLKFVFADGSWKNVTYQKGDKTVKVPANSQIFGYKTEWEKFQLSAVQNQMIHKVKEICTPCVFDVVFVQEDGTETVVSYQYGATSVSEPAVNAKEGFTGYWETYKLNAQETITVKAAYKANEYKVVFKNADGTTTEVKYTFGAKSITEPKVQDKFGYTGVWNAYTLNQSEVIEVEANYTPKTFKVVFTEGNFTEEVTYTFGATSITAPAVPEKAGFTGAWSSYELNKEESVTVSATYSEKTYKVVFVADGKTVSTVEYKYNATSITAPAVPEKEGFEGAWESYELNKAESITVNAVYTPVESQDEKPSLWWLWTSLGVVGVGAAALITYLTKKKKA